MTKTSRARLSELRNLALHDVASALGYQRSKLDRSKWKKNDSIVSINHTQFYDHLSQSGGGGAIDLALHARGGSFADAVGFLETLAPSSPPHHQCGWPAVHHYLCHHRGIDAEVIAQCRRDGIITTDQRNNARFAMRDANARIIGAEIVGTDSDNRFRGLSKGSTKQAGSFWITTGEHHLAKQCTSVMLVESAIDALSVVSLEIPNAAQLIVSTAGLLYALPKWLGEVNLDRIVCGYDTDAPAQLAAECLETDHRVVRLQSQGAKDWNELLLLKSTKR